MGETPATYPLAPRFALDAAVAFAITAASSLFFGPIYGLKAAAVPLLTILAASVERSSYVPSQANRVTLFRAVLVGLMAGWLGEPEMPSWLAPIGALALLLDGVDGRVARRSSTSSAFGGRLDMELDALATAVLCMLVWQADKAGAWVMLGGALRYLWVLAGLGLPWLSGPLDEFYPRKIVCVLEVGVLVAALALPAGFATPLCAVALALLCASFARDALLLFRNR